MPQLETAEEEMVAEIADLVKLVLGTPWKNTSMLG